MARDLGSGGARPTVQGVALDHLTRCVHYHGANDIVSIKMFCCREYFACAECHDSIAGHAAAPWPRDNFEASAVMCGACGAELTVSAYLESGDRCPACSAEFNPRCTLHHHIYFAAT